MFPVGHRTSPINEDHYINIISENQTIMVASVTILQGTKHISLYPTFICAELCAYVTQSRTKLNGIAGIATTFKPLHTKSQHHNRLLPGNCVHSRRPYHHRKSQTNALAHMKAMPTDNVNFSHKTA